MEYNKTKCTTHDIFPKTLLNCAIGISRLHALTCYLLKEKKIRFEVLQ